MLSKGVYPYEYLDEWGKFNETISCKKEEFCSNWNIEDVTDADYMHVKRICKDFEIKRICEHHDLHHKSDTLFLTSILENFIKCF